MQDKLDLYTDYLLTTVSQASATGLSKLVDGAISHDESSRLLSKNSYTSKDLWKSTKGLVRKHETVEGYLIFDDSLIHKPHTDESALIYWHYDHSTGKSVKGINLLTAFYHSRAPDQSLALSVPVSYELVLKTIRFCDVKTQKEKCKSPVTKNELLREMVAQNIHNQLKFKYVLADSWYGSSDNMRFIYRKKKYFIFDRKSNRKAALSETDRNKGQWTRIDALDIPDNTPVKVWLKDLEIPLLLTKQIFTNKNQSTGVRFLVSNDLDLSDDDFTTIYKKRWSVEEYHKSLKQNAAIAKSPTKIIKTQSNHLFAAMLAYVKLETIKFVQQLNHFALKSKIYLAVNKAAFKELCKLKQEHYASA